MEDGHPSTSCTYAQSQDPDDQRTLLDGTLDLIDRGYPIHAYSIVALPFDRISQSGAPLGISGDTQLEAGNDRTAIVEVTGRVRATQLDEVLTNSSTARGRTTNLPLMAAESIARESPRVRQPPDVP